MVQDSPQTPRVLIKLTHAKQRYTNVYIIINAKVCGLLQLVEIPESDKKIQGDIDNKNYEVSAINSHQFEQKEFTS